MARTIVLGDTHGRNLWKSIVEKEQFDKIIFIGDYFDTRDGISPVEQIHNFKEIIEFKKANPGKVILLIGNHDFHYMRGIDERYSGFQHRHRFDISEVIHENIEHLQVCHIQNEYCFTHAGVTRTFLESNDIKEDEHLEQSLNDLFKFTPRAFLFNGYDFTGDDITQSPIWVRPKSLAGDFIHKFHVVGHTSVNRLSLENFPKIPIILIDTLGTTGEYLIIENNKPEVGKLLPAKTVF